MADKKDTSHQAIPDDPSGLQKGLNDAVASLKSAPSIQPAVQRTVLSLRRDSISVEPGALLGQEGDLIARYGISRPTLRQAAALVSQEQLVRIRRGVGGGYFADRPDFTGVTHMAAILLQIGGARVEEMLTAIETIRIELVNLAIDASSAEIEELRSLVETDEAVGEEQYSFRRFLWVERQQNEILSRAAKNQVLRLFMQILLELVGSLGRQDDLLFGKCERFLNWRKQRNRMLRAVVQKDREIAILEAKRCSAIMYQWLEEDRRLATSSDAAKRRKTG